MATYNGEEFIYDQIESILNQTYKNWKLVIHDDGSTDNTLDIINRYATKYKERIVVINDGGRCGGAKENFSHLLKIAKNLFDYNYIMFSDQDDIWLESKIEITLKTMMCMESRFENKPIIVHTDLIVVDAYLNVISESFWKYQGINPNNNRLNCLLLENTVTGSTMMINKHLLKRIYDIPKEAVTHDWWIALVCSVSGGIIYPIKDKTVLYRQHSRNDIGAKKASLKNFILRFIKNPLIYIEKGRNIRSQMEALSKYYPNEFLIRFNKVKDKYLYRKIFYVKENMLCGNLIKNMGKFIFY